VLIARVFLAMTGFPQIGGGGLHVAHVLFGGILMLVAMFLLLVHAGGEVKALVDACPDDTVEVPPVADRVRGLARRTFAVIAERRWTGRVIVGLLVLNAASANSAPPGAARRPRPARRHRRRAASPAPPADRNPAMTPSGWRG
jgi:hypothetical protein